jgi:hypothetical protein
VVIKVFFSVLVLCTIAVVAVVLAIHFRVKRHLRQDPGSSASPVNAPVEGEVPGPPTNSAVGLAGGEENIDSQGVVPGAAEDAAKPIHPKPSS